MNQEIRETHLLICAEHLQGPHGVNCSILILSHCLSLIVLRWNDASGLLQYWGYFFLKGSCQGDSSLQRVRFIQNFKTTPLGSFWSGLSCNLGFYSTGFKFFAFPGQKSSSAISHNNVEATYVQIFTNASHRHWYQEEWGQEDKGRDCEFSSICQNSLQDLILEANRVFFFWHQSPNLVDHQRPLMMIDYTNDEIQFVAFLELSVTLGVFTLMLNCVFWTFKRYSKIPQLFLLC